MSDQTRYAELGFSDEEWGLLVGLPQSVLTAASAAEPDGSRRTMAESAAGLDAIAGGRESGSTLVAAVAHDLVARVGDPEQGEELPPITPADPAAFAVEVLDRARDAAALLRERVDEGEAGAYKHWLVAIADQVVVAAPAGGVVGVGGEVITESERRFRDRLARVLQD
jgi:hypothetical protein